MNKKILILPILIILIASLLLVPVSQASSPITPDNTVTIQGHVLPNGDLALFYFNSPTGINVIHSSTLIPVNKIELDLYSLKAQNMTITVAQFSGYTVHNVTTKLSNNTTLVTPVKGMNNPVYANETITTQYRQLETFSINLPSTSTEKNVSISIDNDTFYLLHKTSPDIYPSFITGLGQLGIALSYIATGVIIFFIATLTAVVILKFMKYWPPFGKLGWTMILFVLLISLGLFIMSDYYQIAYIKFYYWIFPFYAFATLAMLEIWPTKYEKWHIVQVDPQTHETQGDYMTIYVSPKDRLEGSGYEYLDKSRKGALSRLIGRHIPIEFQRGDRDPWHVKVPGENERIYFMTEWPAYSYTEKTYKIFRKEKVRRKRSGYQIPLYGDYMKEVVEMILKLKSVIIISKENQDLKDELIDLKVRIHNGTIQANTEKVDEVTSKILDKKFMPKTRISDEELKKEQEEESKDENTG